MKKITLLTLFCFLTFICYCQITKDNWLLGGSGMFSHDKTTFSTGESISTQINLNPRIGYFVADRSAVGLFGDYGWVSTKSNSIKSSYTNYGIGPFIRYYLLSIENRANLLIEANGAYNAQRNNMLSDESSFISYNFLAGPVIFLNSSVGMEFLLGYKGYKEARTSTKNSGINLNIGIQFHLERDK